MIAILRQLIVRAVVVLAEEDAIRQLHLCPFPPTFMAGFGRGKEPIDFDDLPTALLNFAGQQVQELA
jgi:hypothetical protein